jgi:predicted  nucleic acid-binding Zn-ribbon protein
MEPRTCDTYEVECSGHVVELPTPSVKNNIALCPKCGRILRIEWRTAA